MLLLAIVIALLVAQPAWAGTYTVTACTGPENASWSEWEPSPSFATAYTACPGGALDLRRPQSNEGMMVRNVVGRGVAPRGAAAAMRFDAPAGTVVVGLDADLRMTSNPGWEAGIFDVSNHRWLWCGPRCWSSFHLWMHEELRGLSTRRVEALVRCAAARCRRDARHGFLALRNVRVILDDPSPPGLGGLRGSLVDGGGWLRGGAAAGFDAADNSGVRVGRVLLDGRVVHEDARPCDYTRPVPCSNGFVGASFDTRTWSDGAHVLRFAAADAAGNWASVDREVRVDNTPPVEVAPVLEGGSGWSPVRVRRLLLRLPGGQAAPLVRARVKACRLGGRCHDTAPALEPAPAASAGSAPRGSSGAASSAATARVAASDGPGEYAVRVALEDAAGNVGPYAPPVTMRFDDTRPGAPDLSAADVWRNGGALPLAATGVRPVSGIRGYRVRIGGRQAVVATAFPLDGLPEGGTPVEVTAVSGAGLDGTAVRTLLRLDRSRPSASVEGAIDGWSREPVRLTLRGRDQPQLSGMRTLAWQVDGAAETRADGDVAQVELAGDGRHTVTYRAIDGAGNESERAAVAVKVDRTPPETVAFEAPDPADPRRVRAVVADRTSGVASGRIEFRRAGGAWRPLRTTFEGDRLVALLDDGALPAGPYELRARVSDLAGNEAVGTSRADGTPVVLTLPLRRRTSLAVDRAGGLLRARLRTGSSPLAGRAVVLTQRLRGRTRRHRICAARTVVIPRASRLHGDMRRQPATRCTLRTDSSGRVDVRLPRGPSRTLRFSFAGDALLLPAHGSVTVRTRARARLTARPAVVRAGGEVRFSGRLLGRHVPRTGMLVELQAIVAGRWRTFATVRSDRRGRIRHTRRFSTTSAGSTYRIRLRVPRERSYPFETGRSRAVVVHVL